VAFSQTDAHFNTLPVFVNRHMGFSLYKEVNNYCHSHYRYFGTEDEQAIDEVLMLLKELTCIRTYCATLIFY
jgi:hypothetical protein